MSGPDTTPTAKVEAASRKRASNPARGAKPGERRGGRQKGTPNRVTATLKELAREYTAECLEGLIGVVRNTDSDAARVSAINSLLDRGYGKPSQVLAGDEDGGAIKAVHEIILRGVMP